MNKKGFLWILFFIILLNITFVSSASIQNTETNSSDENNTILRYFPALMNNTYSDWIINLNVTINADNCGVRKSFIIDVGSTLGAWSLGGTSAPCVTNKNTSDLSSYVNTEISSGCVCSGCYLNSSTNYCDVPVLFYIQDKAISFNLTYNSSYDLFPTPTGELQQGASSSTEPPFLCHSAPKECVSGDRCILEMVEVCVPNPKYISPILPLSNLKDMLMGGASLTEMLKAWNPELFDKIPVQFKKTFTQSTISDVFPNLYALSILLIKYILREPASLVANPYLP